MSITKEDNIEGKWIYIEEGAGGHGMHPSNTGKIFIGKSIRTLTFYSTNIFVETYRFSNPNSVECKGHYHDPDDVTQKCFLKYCRYATKGEISKLRRCE